MERKGRNTGYTATVCGATPALLDQRDQDLVCGTRPQHEGVGLIAQRCKQARLSIEVTQAANQHDCSTPQHHMHSKVASSWVPEQQPTQNIMQDTPELEGIGPTMQHKTCIKPTAAVSVNTTADQKGAELMAQPDPDPALTLHDPDPDWATAVSSAADGVSFTEDVPTTCDGNPSPMQDIGHNENIPADAAPTPTPEKLQLAQECPAPAYMAKVLKGAAAIHKSYAQAAQHSPGRTMHALYNYDRSTRCTQKAAKGCKKTQVRVYAQV